MLLSQQWDIALSLFLYISSLIIVVPRVEKVGPTPPQPPTVSVTALCKAVHFGIAFTSPPAVSIILYSLKQYKLLISMSRMCLIQGEWNKQIYTRIMLAVVLVNVHVNTH